MRTLEGGRETGMDEVAAAAAVEAVAFHAGDEEDTRREVELGGAAAADVLQAVIADEGEPFHLTPVRVAHHTSGERAQCVVDFLPRTRAPHREPLYRAVYGYPQPELPR